MKLKRLFFLVLIFSVTLWTGNWLHAGGDARKFSENYPELVCPNVGNGSISQISLTSSKKLVRFLPNKSFKFTPAKTNRILTNTSSVIVDGQGTSSFAWLSKAGVWASGVNCLSSQSGQYFVGTTGDISSKSKLIVINSGLSSSIVDVFTFSEGGSLKKTITIGKNQIATLNVVTLAPGAKSVAMHVIPRTGRVTSYLLDERKKGLSLLGGDVVNSQAVLKKVNYIPGVPNSSSNTSHTLRVFNPGASRNNISVEVISKGGRYIPVGLDNRTIENNKVIDISFEIDAKVSEFALKITSNLPIAASVFSRVGSDFVWSSSVSSGVTGTWAITGLDPSLCIVGSEINANITVLMPRKKTITKNISATDFAIVKLPKGALGLRIDSIPLDSAAALLVRSQSGIGYLPLVNGSVLTRSTVPTANIGVLNP